MSSASPGMKRMNVVFVCFIFVCLYVSGLNNSGEEELSHWNDMRESKGEQVCRWHVLLES